MTQVGELLEKGYAIMREKGMGFYLDVACETGSSIEINRRYIDSLAIEMRILESCEANTEVSWLGQTFGTPIATGAISNASALCNDALVRIASGAKAAGAMVCIGIGDTANLPSVIATGAKVVKIVKPYKDEEMIYQKLQDAQKYGAFAVGMDVSFGFGGKRGDAPNRINLMESKSTNQLKSYINATKLPFIVKGILSINDAKIALESGASAIVVSNHAGASLDYSIPPLFMLPQISEYVAGRVPVFVDGGLRRGSDVFKALALGADGVLMGRAVLAGLAASESEGVNNIITGVTEELRRIMGITGFKTVADIEPTVIHRI